MNIEDAIRSTMNSFPPRYQYRSAIGEIFFFSNGAYQNPGCRLMFVLEIKDPMCGHT